MHGNIPNPSEAWTGHPVAGAVASKSRSFALLRMTILIKQILRFAQDDNLKQILRFAQDDNFYEVG